MKKKPLNSFSALVYSTHPDAIPHEEEQEAVTIPVAQQRLRVILDKKQRKGKVVTLVEGFQGNESALTDLGKALKTRCGTGGNVKDGYILIQGDFRDKVIAYLKEMGFTQTK